MSKNTAKRLFLVDAYALIFRGYFALIKNPRVNSKGEDTSAIMGFMNALLDLIKREQPEYIAVCFDKGGSTERAELFSEYKANRQETPDAIRFAIPHIESLLKAMDIPIVVQEGYEADDLIGTLSKQAEKQGFEVFMVTPDKDFGQLVSEHIFMYRPSRMGNDIEIWGIPQVQERFGVERPEQVIDYLGMMGDASDNIPGLPGVGDKTAKKFIQTYGSLEKLLENLHELSGKLKERIEEHASLGILSKQLATIKTDCDVEFNPDTFIRSAPNLDEIDRLFDTLEFRRLKEQFHKVFAHEASPEAIQAPAQDFKAQPLDALNTFAGSGQFSLFDTEPSAQSLTETIHLYQLVNSPRTEELFFEALYKQTEVSISVFNTAADPMNGSLFGIAFSWQAYKGFYVPLPLDGLRETALWHKLQQFFNSKITLIGHQLKETLNILKRHGFTVNASLFDTTLAHYLINPDRSHDLSVLSKSYLGSDAPRLETVLDLKSSKGVSLELEDPAIFKEYACSLSDYTLRLYHPLKQELHKWQLFELYQELEVPLVRVLAQMEFNGIKLDDAYLNTLKTQFSEQLEQLEQSVYAQADETFNIASPKQLGIVLFEKLKLVDKPKKTKTGQYATSEEILTELAKKHQIASDLLTYRGLAKLLNTYVEALPDQINAETKRIHTQFMQTVAATGRLSSVHPNLQNIPIRTENGRLIRKAFVAKDDAHVLLAADYSQIELRIIAALSEEDTMIEAFKNGEDIHASTASKVFGVALSEVSREQRSQAKTVNFGIIYGVSAFGLSNQTDLSRSDAKELIETYYATYPKLRAYVQNQVSFARENGYVETLFKRRRYLSDINASNAVVRSAAERNAVNAPIQGSAADIIKRAMLAIDRHIKAEGLKSSMLLQVHDELVFDCPKDEIDQLTALVKREMQNAAQLTVPLEVEVGFGANWFEAH
ncbi:MAG: DNA polymerase I [Flavobacteriaceae bacterium]